MKRLLILTAVAALLLQSCNNPEGQQQAPGAMPYPVITLPTKTITAYASYPASVEGTINSAVRAKVSGYITDVLVDEGEQVTKGQTLFKLETAALSQEAEAAQANVNAARVEVEKLKPLVEKNIISSVQLQTAQARLAQAQSAYNSVTANIGYATIKSPVDGYVGSIPFREGALVSPSDPQPLTQVSATDEVFVFFSMNEKKYIDFLTAAESDSREEKINNMPKVKFDLSNGTEYAEEGTIETVTGQVDPNTGTVGFRARFKNPAGLLANGSSGMLRVPTVYENAVVVPEAATFERQGKIYTYKVQGDTLAVSVPITVKDRAHNFIIVASGIEAGDQIVAKGVGKLRNNTPIIPQPVEMDSIFKGTEPVFK